MTDRSVFRTVVVILGLTLLTCVVAIAGLSAMEKDVPGILENLSVGSLTGLAGLLAKGPHDEPQDVNVVNRASDPVPVEAGSGELRIILLFAAAGLLALILYHFIVPHL